MWSLDHQQGEREPSKEKTSKPSLFVSPETHWCGEDLWGGLAAKLWFFTASKSCWTRELPSPWWEELWSSEGTRCIAALPQNAWDHHHPFLEISMWIAVFMLYQGFC